MKNFSLSRYALSVCVAAVLLASCSQTDSTLPQSDAGTFLRLGQLTRELAQSPAGGGALGGGYSGKYTFGPCQNGFKGQDGSFTFSGTGKVSFLRRSKESGALQERHNPCVGWVGTATLTSSRDPQNSVIMLLSKLSTVSPCGQTFNYRAQGGTGKFAKATGSGTVIFHCSGYSGPYSDQWSGMLIF